MGHLFRDVLLLTTGGTIEKVHDWQTEGLAIEPGGASAINDILDQGRCYHVTTKQLLSKDSLDFTDVDRQVIADAVLAASQSAVVISHGTGTLAQTAQFLDGQAPQKCVVLTGAMRPHSFGRSDASFNMGAAILAAQTLSFGVYGVMNGRAFPASAMVKNTQLGRFDA